jgi:hypothetical protein
MSPCLLRRAWIAPVAFALAAVASAQTTWYVDLNGTPPGTGTPADPYTSIQYAIAQTTTVHGDTVLVAPGEYVENVFTMNKRITVRSSSGPLATTIRAAQTGWAVVLFGDPVTLEGFTVTGAAAQPAAGAVQVQAGLGKIRRCILRDSSFGVLSNYDAWLYECTVAGNGVGVRATSFGNSAVISNCIVNFNTTNLIADNGSAGISGSYCLVGVADPGFWDYAQRDLRLRPGSLAIDGGDPFDPPDPDGSVIDVGALTYDPTYAPAPTAYCTAKVNSQGCTPAIGSTGAASASSASVFTVNASLLVDNKSGLLFFGFGPREQPFSGGLHCIQLPTKRVGLQSSGGGGPCSGTFLFDMQSYIQSGVHPGLIPGAMVYCQWWSRDPLDPTGFGTSLTDALSFGIAP